MKNKNSLKILELSLIFLATLLILPSVSAETNVTGCGTTLSTANETYTLNTSLTTTGTCFTIGANNITLDFRGYNIIGDGGVSDYGIYILYYNDTLIKDGFIYNFGRGIYLYSSSNNTFINITSNNNTSGIYLRQASNNNIFTNITSNNNSNGIAIRISGTSNNTFTNIVANNNRDNGIYLYSSSNNTFTNIVANNNTNGGIEFDDVSGTDDNIFINITSNNNSNGIHIKRGKRNTFTNIVANNNRNNGIYLIPNSDNNTFINITSNNNSNGIYLYQSSNNTFTNIVANNNSGNGIYLSRTSNNNNFVNGNASLNTDYDVYLDYPGYPPINNTFLNVSYTNSKEYVGIGSQLIRKWYVDVQVLDPPPKSKPVKNARVIIKDTIGNIFRDRTSKFGLTGIFELISYINQDGTKEIINHIATAEKGKKFGTISFNVTDNQRITIPLSDRCERTDVNSNGIIDNSDMIQVRIGFGLRNCNDKNNWCDRRDVDRDSKVTIKDMTFVKEMRGCLLS